MAIKVVVLTVFSVLAVAASGAQQPASPPAPAPPPVEQPRAVPSLLAGQRPVFRGGTHFVRVDAYPAQDGRIVEGLRPEDFEILEDGRPQTIESFDFIRFDTFTPDAERRDPQTQREGFDKAADPRYRVFVVYVDMAFSQSAGPFAATPNLPHVQQPLVNFLDRIIGPGDLYGFLTSRNSAKDLVLAQKTAVTIEQVKDLWRASVIDRDDADDVLDSCATDEGTREALKARHRADMTYATLSDLVHQLGSLRQERKNVVLATNLLPRWRPDQAALDRRGPRLPRVGVAEGRISADNRRTAVSGNPEACTAEFQRLALMDFEPRYRELVLDAKRENVSFYIITPGGLQAPPDVRTTRAMTFAYDSLRSLAEETDGIAVVNTNDLNAGMKRIADDLAAYYVLGYYTTNTTFDGGLRTLKVRYKANGRDMRARRQYRAPTQAEIAALGRSSAGAGASTGPSAVETALTVLERGARPFAVYAAGTGPQLTVVVELGAASIQAARWSSGADISIDAASSGGAALGSAHGRLEPGAHAAAIPLRLSAVETPTIVRVVLRDPAQPAADDWVKFMPSGGSLLGDPLAFRASSRIARRPVAAFHFARNERIRVEWPVLGAVERREVRLLDRTGKALPVELPLAEDTEKKQLVVEMSLSGLGGGDYLIELTAGAGAITERRLIALRVK